ncbi:hypothetical protein EI983_18360 [Roseovarius faecimaris]|uniref:L,D-TPase catalytic domain-containing protein n=1 Tax=Roseovarius faecimaris TaxID=2494550 RepID=A0A6I6ISS1_9RHOB|nr:L,D-transpeptidase family protein [Roseovarius faecimaris]QGY00120.1 hypothetical protein EI983_18360 [Roseovarius faecimaris]
MRYSRRSALLITLAGLAGASSPSIAIAETSHSRPRFRAYSGPEVTDIVIAKKKRKMWLMSGDKVLKKYRIHLGFQPEGHKQFKGDGKTPEGTYRIDRRNPESDFYLSLGISYPNAQDVAFAKAHGKDPGGDIFIHGKPNKKRPKGRDWTAGCISVTNRQMEEIYAMVKDGTYVTIYP